MAFQGEPGAFSEDALRAYFGDEPVPMARRELRDVGEAVADGTAARGILPIENSVAGSVVASYDVLARGDLEVVGEVVRPIRHYLLGRPGAGLDGLERVLSHPVALAQCTRFLVAHPGIEAVASYDTAGAAKRVAAGGDPAVGAIAGRQAAARYGLTVIAEGIEDRHDNQTRFLIVARAGAGEDSASAGASAGAGAGASADCVPGGRPARDVALAEGGQAPPMKTALLVDTENRPGALLEVLTAFADRAINLSKLDSRPGEIPWSYRFFVELEADGRAPAVREALEQVRARVVSLRVLGSYPAWAGAEAPPPP